MDLTLPEGYSVETDGMEVGEKALCVRPLSEVQPLAHHVLSLVQVTCGLCDWEGSYASWNDHAASTGHRSKGSPASFKGSSTKKIYTKSADGASKSPEQSDHSSAPIVRSNRRGSLVQGSAMMGPMQSRRGSMSNAFPVTPLDTVVESAKPGQHQLERSVSDINPAKKSPRRASMVSLSSNASPTSVNIPPEELKSTDGLDQSNHIVADGLGSKYSSGTLQKAESLKGQANAAFNNRNFEEARRLYTEALAVMREEGSPENREDCQIISSLFSNRAAASFREKNYSACVEDCDLALELDPVQGKAYVRKWRALIALGNVADSKACLNVAVRMLPLTDRCREEIGQALDSTDQLLYVQKLIENEDYVAAREALAPLQRKAPLDNFCVSLLSAKVDAALGFIDTAIKRIERAMQYNSNHAEATQIKGFIMFLSGQTDGGITTLAEAAVMDPTDEKSKTLLLQCEMCNKFFKEGKESLDKGNYEEAVDLFTVAIEGGIEIPQQAPLSSVLRTERAEGLLLCEKYLEALADCQEAIFAKKDNVTAWVIKSEVYFALGRAKEAKEELTEIRKTWGAGNKTIDQVWRKADFELRVQMAEDDLNNMVSELESRGVTSGQESSSPRQDAIPKGSWRSKIRGEASRKSESFSNVKKLVNSDRRISMNSVKARLGRGAATPVDAAKTSRRTSTGFVAPDAADKARRKEPTRAVDDAMGPRLSVY
jgi:tetratricopeptide (TPR) repeat protein